MTAVSPTPEEAAARASLVNVIAAAHDGVTADEAWAVLNGWDSLVAALRDARRENEAVKAALTEPCAECGHIDWRSDGYLEPLIERAERAERERDQAREELEVVEAHHLAAARGWATEKMRADHAERALAFAERSGVPLAAIDALERIAAFDDDRGTTVGTMARIARAALGGAAEETAGGVS